MEGLREIIDALGQRFRTPFFGYFALAFTLVNWKPLFFVLFSDQPVEARFSFFDITTSTYSLLTLPFVLGVGGALVAPWLSFLGALWAEWPTTKRRMRAVRAAATLASEKARLQQIESKNIRDLIESAKAQDTAQREITDDRIRDDLQKQIDDVRQKAEMASVRFSERRPQSNS